MKILMVSSYLPFPLYSGGHIRLYNLIKYLSSRHEITLICEKRNYQTENDIKEVEKICNKVITVDRKRQWSCGNILKTTISLNSFLITGHTLPEMKEEIQKELDTKSYDLVHVETFYVMQNLPKTNIPVVLAEHNVEYLVYKRYSDKAKIYVRPLLYLDIAKIEKQEKVFWRDANGLVAVSEDEKKIMEKEKSKVFLVPNGVDINKFRMKNIYEENKKEKKILFIGDFKWIQNIDTAGWILKEVWPMFISNIKNLPAGEAGQKLNINLVLWIVGKNIPDDIKKLGIESVYFDENAPDDTSSIFREADILLSPKRVGGGTSYKILESMASGTPVITTELGIEGLEAKNEKDILVAEKPEEFVQKIMELLSERKKYMSIAMEGRKLIEENYSWEKIGRMLENVYNEVVQIK